MKEVISISELRNTILSAVNMLCNPVGSTLGPRGNNVIISTSELSPYITNDGVTIAKSIESSDSKINAVLEILKEASLKTDEIMGDGTTTTLVLTKSIIEEGYNLIDSKISGVVIQKELNNALNKVIEIINLLKKIPLKKDFISVASISCNDEKIGVFLSDIYFKMKNKNNIRIEESNNEKTYYEIKKGYSLEIDNISNLYFQNTQELTLDKPSVLVLRGYLENLKQIDSVINYIIDKNKNIIIFVEEISEFITEEILLYYLKEHKNIFIFKLPDYGLRKEEIELDLSYLCNLKIKNINLEEINYSDLGNIKKAVINNKEVILINENENVNLRLDELKKSLINIYDDYDKEFIENRISKLENGIATVYVGGITKTEKREKVMRFIDALSSLEVASKGVVIGGGVTFLKISNELDEKNIGEKILKKALQTPFQKILENMGEDYKIIKKEIEKSNFNKIYNNGEYELISKTNIIDPASVVIETLKNSVSISSMLLTTNYLIINEKDKIEKEFL